jgi:pilus assembly protein CpaE
MKVLDRSDKIYLVMQPVIPYIRAASKLLRLFSLLGYELNKISVISNRTNSDNAISKNDVEGSIQKPIDWEFNNEFQNCNESSNSGVPIIKLEPNCEFSKTLIELAKSISGASMAKTQPKSFFSKFFS